MSTQVQSEKTKWYNEFGIILIFIFIIIYSCLCFFWANSSNIRTSYWSYLWWGLAIIVPLISVLAYRVIDINQKNKQIKYDMVLRHQKFANRLDQIIYDTIKNVDIQEKVQSAITISLNENKNLVNDAIKDGLQIVVTNSSLMNEIFRLFVRDTLNENRIKKAVKAVLSVDDIRKVIKDIKFDDDTITTAVKAAVTNTNIGYAVDTALKNTDFLKAIVCEIKPYVEKIKLDNSTLKAVMKDALKEKMDMFEELETQKYRFVEKVVEELCKNKNIQTEQINAIRDTIDDILHVSHARLLSNENEDIVVIEFSDVNSNRFEIKYNKSGKIIESATPNGKYRMPNQIMIEIEDSNIKKIYSIEEKSSK